VVLIVALDAIVTGMALGAGFVNLRLLHVVTVRAAGGDLRNNFSAATSAAIEMFPVIE
jgi:hypothetical protein